MLKNFDSENFISHKDKDLILDFRFTRIDFVSIFILPTDWFEPIFGSKIGPIFCPQKPSGKPLWVHTRFGPQNGSKSILVAHIPNLGFWQDFA